MGQKNSVHQRSANKYDAQKPNTPKASRERVAVRPAAPLADPVRLLGHPPRGRKRRR